MTPPGLPYVQIRCWLCQSEAERAVKLDLVWLCADCVVALAALALPHDRMRQQAAARTQRRQ